MTYCKQLDLKFEYDTNTIQTEFIHQFNKYQKYSHMTDRFVLYSNIYSVDDQYDDYVKSLLPPSLRDLAHINVVMIENTSSYACLPPHVDILRKSCINIYHATNNEVTSFLNDDISVIESFTAHDGDCWLMDGSKLHQVEFDHPTSRAMTTVSFRRKTFNDILQAFQV